MPDITDKTEQSSSTWSHPFMRILPGLGGTGTIFQFSRLLFPKTDLIFIRQAFAKISERDLSSCDFHEKRRFLYHNLYGIMECTQSALIITLSLLQDVQILSSLIRNLEQISHLLLFRGAILKMYLKTHDIHITDRKHFFPQEMHF